jgi:hypothetical protein
LESDPPAHCGPLRLDLIAYDEEGNTSATK